MEIYRFPCLSQEAEKLSKSLHLSPVNSVLISTEIAYKPTPSNTQLTIRHICNN